jgi:hypothetical protein
MHNWPTNTHMILTLNLNAMIKSVVYAIASGAFVFFVPLKGFILFVLFLVIFDLYTGRKAARHRGELMHSKGLKRTVLKFIMYFIALLIARGVEVVFMQGFFEGSFVWTISAVICWTEVKSNFENIGEVTGNDLWKVIASKVPSINDWVMPKKKKGDE